jgi:hypothetical protein
MRPKAPSRCVASPAVVAAGRVCDRKHRHGAFAQHRASPVYRVRPNAPQRQQGGAQHGNSARAARIRCSCSGRAPGRTSRNGIEGCALRARCLSVALRAPGRRRRRCPIAHSSNAGGNVATVGTRTVPSVARCDQRQATCCALVPSRYQPSQRGRPAGSSVRLATAPPRQPPAAAPPARRHPPFGRHQPATRHPPFGRHAPPAVRPPRATRPATPRESAPRNLQTPTPPAPAR